MFGKGVVVEPATGFEGVCQYGNLRVGWTHFVDIGTHQSRVRLASIYRRIISDERVPAVLMKYKWPQSDGIRRNIGNFSRNIRLDVPFSRAAMI